MFPFTDISGGKDLKNRVIVNRTMLDSYYILCTLHENVFVAFSYTGCCYMDLYVVIQHILGVYVQYLCTNSKIFFIIRF